VLASSPYKTVEDLKGKNLALVDPNSTSGNQAPRFFLKRAGYDVEKFFGKTFYAGSHENAVLALTQGLAAELAPRGVRLQAVLPGITRTELFARAGADLDRIPAAMIMEARDLVAAALAGLDAGEPVTIPSLPEIDDWAAFEAARLRLGPNLSRSAPAARYGLG